MWPKVKKLLVLGLELGFLYKRMCSKFQLTEAILRLILAAEVAAELAEIQEKEELEKQMIAAREELSSTGSPENVYQTITNILLRSIALIMLSK